MWFIAGTSPTPLPLEQKVLCSSFEVAEGRIHMQGGHSIPVERGTEALAATAWLACKHLGAEPLRLVLAHDKGSGDGSRNIYAYLERHAAELAPSGVTFHYLFPDVDWHNRVLMAMEALPARPTLVADAGFMYVAKMSGYADAYDLFTPDIGEMSFLADEKAPHPFYTRGFLLDSNDSVDVLLARARAHGNVPKHLIIKGGVDYIAAGPEDEVLEVCEPSVPAMEAIGGTGDVVTGLVTALLATGMAMPEACLAAARAGREIGRLAKPTPATQVGELLLHVGAALDVVLAGRQAG